MKYLFLLLLLLACKVEEPVLNPTVVVEECKKLLNGTSTTTKLDLQILALKQLQVKEGTETLGQVSQRLSLDSGGMWIQGAKLKVCWENVDPNDSSALETKRAVDETWNKAFELDLAKDQGVKFYGWERCVDGDGSTIRINVDDINPHVLGLGAYSIGVEKGMSLNFTFKNWSPDCSMNEWTRMFCVYNIAVHEFGHALGLTHEQNRTDTADKACAERAQGPVGDKNYGPWDLYSVMNYCNPKWLGYGNLSAIDLLGVRAIYAPAIGKNFCQHLLDTIENQKKVYGSDAVESEGLNKMLSDLFYDTN